MEFRLKNDLAEIQLLAEAVETFGKEFDLPVKAIFHVNLALDELLTNTISYGYPEGGQHEILVRITLQQKDILLIEIRDDGFAFNPLESAQPDIPKDIDEWPLGGLGIHLVRKMLDELEYTREDDQNILLMRKRINLS